MSWIELQRLAIALALGLLVGFQRERTAHRLAGIRTFALVCVFGAVTASFPEPLRPWLIALGFVGVLAVVVAGSLRTAPDAEDPGVTTEIAALLTFVVGAVVGLGRLEAGVLLGGGTAVLLQWKRPLHAFVRRLGENDVRAIIRFALISLVVLPLLPDRSFDPYRVLNPFEIWLMVVLIVGISLLGYVAFRFLGSAAGTLLGGALGGVISSTATTVSYARRAARSPGASRTAAAVIAIASTVVFVRVLIELAVVAPGTLRHVAPPLLAMLALMVAVSAALYRGRRGTAAQELQEEDPADLRGAIFFGLLYAVVLFCAAVVSDRFGDRGLYVVAMLSGLTDMDAITLSTAQMLEKGRIDVDVGWRTILIGALSNLAFKGGAVALLGPRSLTLRVAAAFGVAGVFGVLLLLFWP